MQGGVQIPLDIHFAQSSLGATDLNSCQSEHHADNVPVATHQPGVQNPPDSHFAQRSPGATELNNYQPEHHVDNLLVAKHHPESSQCLFRGSQQEKDILPFDMLMSGTID